MSTRHNGNASAPAYPSARPDHGDDPRFSIGLVLDIAAVLTRHGYPPITCGTDLTHLQQALFKAIYQETP
jgi:hypothetical protein